MKILVYGAGVLGSLYAAQLQQAGHNVAILARGQRLDDIRTHGVVLEEATSGQHTTIPLKVVGELAPTDAYDWVIVLMRKNQVAAILPTLAANTHTPNVLFMINNAAGPDEYIAALGREWVVLGFPGAGGTREGYVVRYVAVDRKVQATTLGELNGQTTPRLAQIARAFEEAGFGVSISPNMDAWLKTHVALVSPIANALYLAGGSNYRLARTRDGLVLLVRAVREGLRVLRALDVPITPAKFRVLAWIPEPLLVLWMQRGLATPRAELAMARHTNAARDEMKQLADEFQVLARRSGLPVPAIDRLYTFIDPQAPVLSEGSAQLSLDWRSVLVGVGVLAGIAVLVAALWPRRK